MTKRQLMALLALAGCGVATYLAMYKLGYIGQLACSISSCEEVNTSRWSIFLNVPVAVWGVGFYLATFLVAAMASVGRFAEARLPALLLTLMTGAGVLFSGYLTSMELFVIHAICVWCVVSACIVTTTFVISILELRASTLTANIHRR